MYSQRDKIIYYSLKYDGHVSSIQYALDTNEYIDKEKFFKSLTSLKCPVITILDKEYPIPFKSLSQPPLCLFYTGDIELLDSESDQIECIKRQTIDGIRLFLYYNKHDESHYMITSERYVDILTFRENKIKYAN